MKKGLRKKYWLYIDSYTHIAVKKERVLLYNSYTGKMLEYINELEILGLVKRLLRPSNLQTVLLTDQDLRRPVIRKFVESIREYFIGDLIDASHSRGKPVQMPSILKIRKDVKILKKDSQRTIGEDIIEYLSDIWLYINDRCNQDCWLCSRAYRQFPFCTAIKRGNQELAISLIEIFFRELQHRDHMNIHILGGDTLAYSQMNQLFQTLKIQWTYYLYIHYLNAAGKTDRLRFAAEHGVRLKVPVTFPLDNKKMEETLDTFSATNIKYTLLFPVRNVEEFQMADELIKKFQPLTSEFHPFFDKIK